MFFLLLLPPIFFKSLGANPGRPFPPHRIDRAYEALKIFNYFKAREIFLRPTKKWPVLYAHGLAVIYFRNDNPFFDPEKAYQQVRMAISGLYISNKRELKRLDYYGIQRDSLIRLRSAIESRLFPIKTKNKTLEEYEVFLRTYSDSWLRDSVIRLRNRAAFAEAVRENTPSAYLGFMQKYPGAEDSLRALVNYDRRLFETYTATGKCEDFEKFITEYPQNPYVSRAVDSVYHFYLKTEDPVILYSYIKKYSSSPHINAAWSALFFWEIKDLSTESLTRFLKKYPDYPEKNRLNEEIQLAAKKCWVVRESGLEGCIDGSGRWIIPPSFEHLEPFSEGYAAAMSGGKAGFINRKGEKVIPFQFAEVASFKKGFAAAKNEQGWGLLNHGGAWIIQPQYEEMEHNGDSMILVSQSESYFFIDYKGKPLWTRTYAQLSGFKEGLCLAEDSGKYGYLRPDGTVAVPFIYDWAEPFSSGLARVQLGDFFGLIDNAGHQILPAEYDFVGAFDKGLALVIKEGRAGFVNEFGEITIPLQFDVSAEMQTGKIFNDDLARVRVKGKAGIIDRAGNFVIPPKFTDVQPNRYGNSAVKKGNAWFILDKSMKLLPLTGIDYISSFRAGSARAKKKGLWGIIDEKGKWLVKPVFEGIEAMNNDYLRVEKEGFFGLMGSNGELILPAQYTRIQFFSEDMLQIEKNGKHAVFIPNLKQYLWKEKDF